MYDGQKLDLLLAKFEDIQDTLQMFMPNLQLKRNVLTFLDITEPTLNHYIKNGVLEEGLHYEKVGKNKLRFIPEAIIAFKKSGIKRQVEMKKPLKVEIEEKPVILSNPNAKKMVTIQHPIKEAQKLLIQAHDDQRRSDRFLQKQSRGSGRYHPYGQ
jgi:hypothetical protein